MRQILHAAGASALSSKVVALGGDGAAVQIVGTFVGTLTFEMSVDRETWAAVGLTPVAGGAAATTATAPGMWHFDPRLMAGYFRLRVSAYTSGSIDAYFISSPS